MNPQERSILSPQSACARVMAFTLFGLMAGVALFITESVDRLAVLGHSLYGASEWVEFVILMGSTVLGVQRGALDALMSDAAASWPPVAATV